MGIIIFVILLLPAHSQTSEDSFVYGFGQKAYSRGLIDASNQSPTYGLHNLEGSKELAALIF